MLLFCYCLKCVENISYVYCVKIPAFYVDLPDAEFPLLFSNYHIISKRRSGSVNVLCYSMLYTYNMCLCYVFTGIVYTHSGTFSYM